MYVSQDFDTSEPAWCYALIRRESFATVVTTDTAGVPFATHVPVELDAERGSCGTIVGHLARANPHSELLRAGRPTLIVFAGPHAYVSPAWYTHHPSVPTWNYVVVHATGVPAVIDDYARVRTLLERLVERYEAGRAAPWRFDALPEAARPAGSGVVLSSEIARRWFAELREHCRSRPANRR